ncbi:MAG: radical SAM/SPASM domain-containing protein [Thermodesulfobacteriota bacterium]
MSASIKERIRQSAVVADHALVPAFPKNILFELTNACNHACRFCYNHAMRRRHGHLDWELYKRLIAEAAALGAREAGFATTGEPFASPIIFDCIAEAKRVGIAYTYLSTNGALLSKAKVERIFESGLDSIKFSINAGNRESYKRIHGRDDFDHVLDMVRLIDSLRRQRGRDMKLFCTTILTRDTKGEEEALRKLVGHCFDDMFFAMETGASGPTNSCVYRLPCPLLFNRAHVTWEGYLTICCVDFENSLVVANLRETSLEEAWRSPLFQWMRRRHLEKDVSGTLCDVCISKTEKPYVPLGPV